MRALIPILAACLSVSCGGSGGGTGAVGGSEPEPETKSLFSAWTATVTGTRLDLNLTGKGYQEEAPLKATFPQTIGGGVCDCVVTVRNLGSSMTEGTFAIQRCEYDFTSADNATAANLCNGFADLGSYIHDPVAKRLQVCVESLGDDCVEFR